MASKEKADSGQQPEFGIQRLYVKDSSFESPNSPGIFLEQWQPEVNMDLGVEHKELEANTFEVVLKITVNVKVKDKSAFLVEIQQAGVFAIKNFPKEQMDPMLESFCPNILYPYAREAITAEVIKGGFPQLYLAPVNFDALYQQKKQQQAKKDKGGSAASESA